MAHLKTLFPLEPCPHCPVPDPLQRILEKTSFYDEYDDSDDDEDDDPVVFPEGPDALKTGGDRCSACQTPRAGHPPPYGPWCSLRPDSFTSPPHPLSPPLPSPRIRRFRLKNLQPFVDACLGTGSIGSVFVANYRQKRIDETPPDDVFNLVIKRIGSENDDFFGGGKSLDPTVAEMEKKIINLKHHHLIKVYAVIGGNKIVMERALHGSLVETLRQEATQSRMTRHHLTYLAFQVADGMAYLEKNAVIHGRLAARNVLISEVSKCKRWMHIKLSDFGIPTKTSESRERRLPWMSPEEMTSIASPSTAPSSSKSCDCWSYGILLHEIFTFGKRPYYDLSNLTLKRWVPQGYRMRHDPLVPEKIYAVMLDCWQAASLKRPSFRLLQFRLWNLFREIPPDFLCRDCGDKGLTGGIGTRNK